MSKKYFFIGEIRASKTFKKYSFIEKYSARIWYDTLHLAIFFLKSCVSA